MSEIPDGPKGLIARSRRAVLIGCVSRMRAAGVKGATRDTAAVHYLAGACEAAKAFGLDLAPDVATASSDGYLGVLEALAEVSELEEEETPAPNADHN